ncbi:hypothetical protein [Stenotrophomonas sp.]|uniref:hypothetical protein n=1 Tax=Stenotrophomonas sp. TaxID=69392 RepID=UPI0028AC3E0B|nr:hypothetical protein [Stenotrophomonas sp.]
MSQPSFPTLSDLEIKRFLQEAPLYSWREFQPPEIERSSLAVTQIDLHCEICDKERPFMDLRSSGGGAGSGTVVKPVLRTGTSYFTFRCVTCRKDERNYLVEQVVEGGTVRVQKYGERPRGRVPRDRRLQKFLQDDRENYEKAVLCLSHEYGIAAFAYFRRIVETNIGRLLELVEEDAKASGGDAATLSALQELRKESPMSERIKLANLALPHHLRPDGLNPLGRLYQVLSEGVHSLSEEDCLRKARDTSECLAFLVSELTARRQHREKFKAAVSQL